jgi:hypothetical protein
MKKEDAELKRKMEEQAEAEKKLHETGTVFPEIQKQETLG